jgi:LCP family protein required for cell wall assembly
VIANLTVFAVLAGAATVVGYASYEIGSISRVAAPGLSRIVPDPKVRGSSRTSPPFTMLIVGSDTRALKGPIGVAVGNTTTNPEDLSDSIILVRVDPSQHRLALLSIPRDLYVAVPGLGTTKINSAFAGNDPGRLITVIRDDLGIPVNHFAEVNFYTFEQIADAIGGVEQYFPTPAFDVESGLQIPKAGCIDLKGEQALGFVRSRNYFYVLDGDASLQLSPESDLGRIQRQQAFVKNAIAKVGRSHALTDPLTLTRLVSAVTKNLTLDNTFSDRKIIDLAEDFAHVDAVTIPNLTYPVVNSGDGLVGVPGADAATVAEFEDLGAAPTTATTATTAGGASPTSTARVSTGTGAATTTVPRYGNAYSSGTEIVPSASSYFHGVYIPPGRVPGQVVKTCGN